MILPSTLSLRQAHGAGAPRSRAPEPGPEPREGPGRQGLGDRATPDPDWPVLYVTLGFGTGRGAATLRTGTPDRGSPARSRLSNWAPAPCGRRVRIALHLARPPAPPPRGRGRAPRPLPRSTASSLHYKERFGRAALQPAVRAPSSSMSRGWAHKDLGVSKALQTFCS